MQVERTQLLKPLDREWRELRGEAQTKSAAYFVSSPASGTLILGNYGPKRDPQTTKPPTRRRQLIMTVVFGVNHGWDARLCHCFRAQLPHATRRPSTAANSCA